MTLRGGLSSPLSFDPLPPGRQPILLGPGGIARIGGVPVANILGLIQSAYTEFETQAYFAAGGNTLSLDDIAAAAAFARRG